jgi:hypothetical protein
VLSVLNRCLQQLLDISISLEFTSQKQSTGEHCEVLNLCISHTDFNTTAICDVRTPKISANAYSLSPKPSRLERSTFRVLSTR